MEEALLLSSRAGFCKTTIHAYEIKSREQARKLWPLVAPDRGALLTWVSYWKDPISGRQKRSHFRRLPKEYQRKGIKSRFEKEESERQKSINESKEHKAAKCLIRGELERRLQHNEPMPWFFSDPSASDFPFQGDLLFGATKIEEELTIKTGFGPTFRLDVGIMAPPIVNEDIILGGVEIEFENSFDGRKALIGRSLGFPLISIDITGMALAELTEGWAKDIISLTTLDHALGLRKTYIYLPTALYPLYLTPPSRLQIGERHQYIAFADKKKLNILYGWFKKLISSLGYSNQDIALMILNAKNDTAKVQLKNAGDIVGEGWQNFNDYQCLRITLPRPAYDSDKLRNHKFHMTMARLFATQEVLLGYKYDTGGIQHDLRVDVWMFPEWDKARRENDYHKLLPKRLAEPIGPVLRFVESMKKQRADKKHLD